jgi:hypothetical protein
MLDLLRILSRTSYMLNTLSVLRMTSHFALDDFFNDNFISYSAVMYSFNPSFDIHSVPSLLPALAKPRARTAL